MHDCIFKKSDDADDPGDLDNPNDPDKNSRMLIRSYKYRGVNNLWPESKQYFIHKPTDIRKVS